MGDLSIQVHIIGLGVSLPIPVKKSWTIGQVVRQIDSEYFSWKRSNEASSAVGGLPDRIECGALFDADPTLDTSSISMGGTLAPVPLRYTDSVEQVLDAQSRLYAVNILSKNTSTRSDTIETRAKTTVEPFQSPSDDLPTLAEGLSSPISASSSTIPSSAASPPPPSSSSSNPSSPITPMPSLLTRPRPRSRVTGQLLLLTNPRESSSNDVRFQAILHNTIALDHFRQFCFQEYSIENLLFWMDVELFASPSQELLDLDKRKSERTERLAREDGDEEREDEEDNEQEDSESEHSSAEQEAEKGSPTTKTTALHSSLSQHEHFSVQHARYIYLTYIDACAPLQVNLSDEIRSEIPWPILDESNGGISPAVDRHIFDAAQEHTYQLMKGHTLARFEESDLWKAVESMIQEKPEDYTRANIDGTFNSHYRPSTSVIRDLVRRSKSRSPTALPHALYNWNNSTSDLDRGRDKEETLAEVMRQYFGPIPAALRHQTKLLRGLGLLSRAEEEEYELGLERAVASGVSGDKEGIGSGDLLRPPRMPRTNSTNTFLSVYSQGGHQSNRNSVISSTVDLATTKRFSTASAIATRWMVAGYFDDEIRLTSAQRRKLLHRNNKLTRFFGSRVDGTLMPVHDGSADHYSAGSTQKHQGSEHSEASSGRRSGGHRSTASSASLGSSIALGGATSSLSMAMSNSNLQNQGQSKDNAKKSVAKSEKRSSFSSPAGTTLTGSSGRRGSKSMVIRLPSQRERFFARFRPRPRSTLIDSAAQASAIATEHHRFSFVIKDRQTGSSSGTGTGKRASMSSFPTRKEGFLSRTSMSCSRPTKPSHKRVMTQPHPLPHPLWMGLDRRGSLSDHEGISPSDTIALHLESQRVAPLMNVAGGDIAAAAIGPNAAVTEASNTSRSAAQPLHESNLSAMQGSASTEQDSHQSLRSRRKKADKLASFFGTPLTPWELSTQLKMEQEADALVSDASHHQQQSPKGSSESSRSQQHQQPVQLNPTYASINQLSERDRSILWKRSKKLKELLGQSLPEMDVEAALTLPVLRRRGSSRSIVPLSAHYLTSSFGHHLHVSGSSVASFRRRRPGSRVSIRSRRQSLANQHLHTRRRQSTVSTAGMRPVSMGSLESSEWLLQGHDGNCSPSSPHRSIRSATTSSVSAKHQSSRYLSPAGHHRRTSSPDPADKDARQRGFHGQEEGGSSLENDGEAEHMDGASGVDDDDDDDDLYEEVSTDSSDDECDYEGMGRSTRALGATTATNNSTTTTGATAGLGKDGQCASARLGQKKRMDKIHQFMGERVPKQDLWVGAVGRETARKVLESFMAEDPMYLDDWEDAMPPPPAAATEGRRQTLSSATSPMARLRTKRGNLMAKRRSKKAAAAAAAAAAQLKEKSMDEGEEENMASPTMSGDGQPETSSTPVRSSMSSPLRGGAGQNTTATSMLSSTSPLSSLLNVHHRSEKKKVRTERSLSDPPALPSSFAPRAFVKGVFRSGKDSSHHHNPGQGHRAGADASVPQSLSSSSSPKSSTVIFGRSSADAILNKTTYAAGMGGHHPATMAAGDLKCLDEETLQSMPRLRTMAAGDKERFMKRAEKLNKLFGAIPPSALLESSLTTFPLTRGLRTEDEEDEEGQTEKGGDASPGDAQTEDQPPAGVPQLTLTGAASTTEVAVVETETSVKKSGRHAKGSGKGSISSFSSLYELAGRLASHSGGSSPSPVSSSHANMDLKDETANVVESLAI